MLKVPIAFSLMFDYFPQFCQNSQSTVIVNICVSWQI